MCHGPRPYGVPGGFNQALPRRSPPLAGADLCVSACEPRRGVRAPGEYVRVRGSVIALKFKLLNVVKAPLLCAFRVCC